MLVDLGKFMKNSSTGEVLLRKVTNKRHGQLGLTDPIPSHFVIRSMHILPLSHKRSINKLIEQGQL
jgi:hypothetical protein